MSMEDNKLCNSCGVKKLKSQFQKHRAVCKLCRNTQMNKWKLENKEQHNLYQKEYKLRRYKEDINFKIKVILRSRVRKFLKNEWKSGSSIKMLGCSINELKIHLESKFQEGMNWSNWGKLGWHVDHIKPLAQFDLSDPIEMAKACHYTNLQPLWATDNCSKSDKVEYNNVNG